MKEHQYLKLLTLTITCCLYSSNAIAKCEQEYKALQNQQTLMKKGHSASTMARLKAKEHKLAETYQNCRSGKNRSAKRKVKVYKHAFASNNSNRSAKSETKSYGNLVFKAKNSTFSRPIRFNTKFEGDKQKAWIAHYKTPKACLKPKSTAKFAECIQHRNAAAHQFSQQWDSTNK